MDVVSHASDTICLATRIPRDGGKIGMQFRLHLCVEERPALLCAEDHVDYDKTQ